MLSERQLKELSEQVYWVEEFRSDVDYHPDIGNIYAYNRQDMALGQFQVLKVTDNTENGMQAMAVAL